MGSRRKPKKIEATSYKNKRIQPKNHDMFSIRKRQNKYYNTPKKRKTHPPNIKSPQNKLPTRTSQRPITRSQAKGRSIRRRSLEIEGSNKRIRTRSVSEMRRD